MPRRYVGLGPSRARTGFLWLVDKANWFVVHTFCLILYERAYVYMYVCIVITYSKSKDQSGNVANLARGQLNRKNELFPVPAHA